MEAACVNWQGADRWVGEVKSYFENKELRICLSMMIMSQETEPKTWRMVTRFEV
jgi:hypothetical protein